MMSGTFFNELAVSFKVRIDADEVSFYVLDETSNSLVWVAGGGDAENPKRISLQKQDYSKLVKIVGKEEDYMPLQGGSRSLIIPLFDREKKIIGTLNADRKEPSKEFSEVDVAVANSFGEAAAIALEINQKNVYLKKLTSVFVLMPFASSFDDIYNYGIKRTIEGLGIRCERVDEIQHSGDVLSKIFESIDKASFIVADMTGRNPNVFYEVGYCHATKKEVILCTQSVDDIPFDLRGRNHIVYSGKINLLEEALKKRILHLIDYV